MGKTTDPPKPTIRPQEDVILVRPDPATAEQLRRQYAPLRELLQQHLERSLRMTPEEQRRADEDWEKLKQTLNEGRTRKVILDDDDE